MVKAHLGGGGAVYLVTLTLPHDQGDSLGALKDAVTDAWRHVVSGAPWLRMKARIGYVGYLKSLEVTAGPSGWHPHLHVLLFTKDCLSDDQTVDLEAFFFRRWCNRITAHGFRQPSFDRGIDLRIGGPNAGDYLVKLGLAAELVSGLAKEGRNGHRTPMQILADLVSSGDAVDLRLWREWVVTMHGVRQLTWSTGLRERYANAGEVADDLLASDEPAEEDAEVLVTVIPPHLWRQVAAIPGLASDLLDIVEGCARRDELHAACSLVWASIRESVSGDLWPTGVAA